MCSYSENHESPSQYWSSLKHELQYSDKVVNGSLSMYQYTVIYSNVLTVNYLSKNRLHFHFRYHQHKQVNVVEAVATKDEARRIRGFTEMAGFPITSVLQIVVVMCLKYH